MSDRRARRLPPRPHDAVGLEVEHHVAELADRLIDQGMERDAAVREAERRFGDLARYRAHLERGSRMRAAARAWLSLGSLLADAVGGAARTLRRRPGFAAAVVLTLGLGIGANGAMFGILDRLLFRPPDHVRDSERVLHVKVIRTFMGQLSRQASVTFPDYEDFRRLTAFREVAALSGPSKQTIGRGVDATRVRAMQATSTFFPLVGVAPEIGRFYDADDDRIGAAPTVVLSHEYWSASFAADPGVLGRTLSIAGGDYRVIGVAPEGFTGVLLDPVDVWLPLQASQGLMAGTEWHDSRGYYWLRVVARLADAVAPEGAAAAATTVHRLGRAEQIAAGRYEADAKVELDPLILARGPGASAESRVARWLGGVSLAVLLIACANVANLLLANGAGRRREIAVRLALGIARSRLVVQMVLESAVLAIGGSVVALAIADWGGKAMQTALLPGVSFPGGAITGRTLVFTIVLAALAGLMAGIAPAVQGTRADLANDLSGAGRGSARRSRLRAGLTVLQAALSVVLLVGAGLFVRSVSHIRGTDLGLDIDRLLLSKLEFETSMIPGSDPDRPPDPATTSIYNELYLSALRRLAPIPGVEAAAATDSPFQFALGAQISVPGLDSIPQLSGGGPYFQDVTPGYIATVGLRVVRGRDLAASDDANAENVTLVSETMARSLWPDVDALGKTFFYGGGKDPRTAVTVVGVVEDASRGNLEEDPFMGFYMPIAQRQIRRLNGLYVRADPKRIAEVEAAIAPVLRSFDPRVRFASVTPLREIIDPQARSWTLGATMFTIFGVLALIVAAVGLYSVLAFDVAQRTREIGIRSALGADKGRLLAAVVGDGVVMAGAGVMLGLLTAMALAPYARALLYQVSPRDPGVLLAVAAVLVATAVVASIVPALRATRVDPIVALRAE